MKNLRVAPKVSLGKPHSSHRLKRQIGCDLGRPSAGGEGDDAEGAGGKQSETGWLGCGSGWGLRGDGEGVKHRRGEWLQSSTETLKGVDPRGKRGDYVVLGIGGEGKERGATKFKKSNSED